MKAMRTALAIGSAGMLMLGACNEKNEPGAGGPGATSSAGGGGAKKAYVFGVIAKSQSNPVFQAARTGAEDAARELSKELGTSITIDWRTPINEDAQQQAQYLEQLVGQGVDGIAISASDAKLLETAINDAVDRGVEVCCFDSDVPASKRFAYYGIDDVEAGRTEMKILAQEMGGTGVVAILAGNQNAPNLQARVRGVKEVIDATPGLTLKDVYYHAETAPDAAAKVQQVQAANPDITGWAMVGGWPLFTDDALDGVYQSAKVVAVDHLPQELNYVREGQVQALVGQDCYGWGHESVVMLVNKVIKGESPEKVINTFDLQIVNADNVDDWEGTWETWLGTH